jgi:hypothetical protein
MPFISLKTTIMICAHEVSKGEGEGDMKCLKRNPEAILNTSKHIGPEVTAEKISYVLMLPE